MSEIIVLRTHYYDQQVDRWVRYLKAGSQRRIVAVVDERKAAVAIPGDILKIRLDPQADGLLVHPDYGWRCGDYALYAAAQAVPEATRFWMVEPDVRIHADSPKGLFDGVEETRDADFVTAWHVQSSPEWVWYKTISAFVEPVFNCMLQLYRISRPAVSYLFEQRRALTAQFAAQNIDPRIWPNDEAFIGAMLAQGGFRVATFKTHAPAFHTEKIFSFTRPTSLAWLDAQPYDNGIYHPVVSGAKFRSRMLAHLGLPDQDLSGANVSLPGADEAMLTQLRFETGPGSAVPSAVRNDRVTMSSAHSEPGSPQPESAVPVRNADGERAAAEKKTLPIRSWNRIRNNGDAITSIIVDKVFDANPRHAKESEPHMLGVGSIMFMANRYSVIWGCGVLNEVAYLPDLAAGQIRALRGKKSADLLTRKGVALGDIAFGDPGILVDALIGDSVENAPRPKHRVAVVPHHDAVGDPFYAKVRQRDDVCIVDMLDDGLTPVIQIAQADIVLSQSLHGLIYAEAFGKPSLWISSRSDVVWNFKFEDWFTTTRNPQAAPVMMDRPFESMVASAEIREMTISRQDLIDAFPSELFQDAGVVTRDYADCRAVSPLIVSMLSQPESVIAFEVARDTPALKQLSKDLMSATFGRFHGWAERPYVIAVAEGSRAAPNPAQARVMAHAMDVRSGIDNAFVVQKLTSIPTGVSAIELGEGVIIYRNYKAMGDVVLLRPFATDLTENFVVFGV